MRSPGPGPGPQVGTHRKGSGQRNPETPRLPQLRFLPRGERQASSLPEHREDQELPLLSGQEGAGRAANRVGSFAWASPSCLRPQGSISAPSSLCWRGALTHPWTFPAPPHPTPPLPSSPRIPLPLSFLPIAPVLQIQTQESSLRFDSGGDSPFTAPPPRKKIPIRVCVGEGVPQSFPGLLISTECEEPWEFPIPAANPLSLAQPPD